MKARFKVSLPSGALAPVKIYNVGMITSTPTEFDLTEVQIASLKAKGYKVNPITEEKPRKGHSFGATKNESNTEAAPEAAE